MWFPFLVDVIANSRDCVLCLISIVFEFSDSSPCLTLKTHKQVRVGIFVPLFLLPSLTPQSIATFLAVLHSCKMSHHQEAVDRRSSQLLPDLTPLILANAQYGRDRQTHNPCAFSSETVAPPPQNSNFNGFDLSSAAVLPDLTPLIVANAQYARDVWNPESIA
ncbi:hypothetical protein BDD12DRAFT_479258 [Trichophaea hybrida]|nr:hypothetical protein BDD12DRAFT_479258 [Trichophaea hybrida]